MMPVPPDLQKLPPQALDVLHFLAAREDGTASADAIMNGAGLSAIGLGKGIRRLVTVRYVTMTAPSTYALTALGREAAQALRAAEPAPAPGHARRLSVFAPCELAAGAPALLRAGFDPPDRDQLPPGEAVPVILRLRAPDCDISPAEQPVIVPPDAPGGPVRFRVTPRQEGMLRLRLEVLPAEDTETPRPAGGIYFDLGVAPFPTPACAEFQALGATVVLPPGRGVGR
ncbi:MAG: hypothetical protein KBH93_02465 [Anaerolineae bacterium]|nr:hypothetical protein [Anaerolineae bacterium]